MHKRKRRRRTVKKRTTQKKKRPQRGKRWGRKPKQRKPRRTRKKPRKPQRPVKPTRKHKPRKKKPKRVKPIVIDEDEDAPDISEDRARAIYERAKEMGLHPDDLGESGEAIYVEIARGLDLSESDVYSDLMGSPPDMGIPA